VMATNERLGSPVRLSMPRAVLLGVCAVVGGTAVAYLVAYGLWLVVLALVVAVPGFVLLHRYPLVVLTVWLLVLPLVDITSSAALRSVFWLVHRTLPVVALAVVVVSAMLRINDRRLARLGLPEVLMGGYLVATLLSIAYTSDFVSVTVILLYDRVFIPMVLYLLVRLLEPDERDLKLLIPAIAFVLFTQTLIAVLSWTAPGVLPSEWLGKLGERTTGSLRTADVFGVTVLFCGLFLLHAGLMSNRTTARAVSVPLFGLALIMVFFTFSRTSWLAGLVAMIGLLFVYPRFVGRFVWVVVPLVVVMLVSGMFAWQVRFAQDRFLSEQSEESALSRLPVAYAAARMFGAKPLTGWGYENFDKYDFRFQSRVGDLVYPEKDHASHNLYLTILAEQGLIGFVLFLGPMFYWLARTRSGMRRMPATGFISRKLVLILWLVIAGNIVINNFVRVQVSFGLGMWWVTLGLIASLLARHLWTPDRDARDREAVLAATARGPMRR